MQLQAQVLELPLAAPFRIATGLITRLASLIVEARGQTGPGFGEAVPSPAVTLEDHTTAVAALRTWTSKGKDLEPLITDTGRPLATPAAWAAVEGAWLDARAREEEIPLVTYLTGRATGPLATSITLPLVPSAELHSRVTWALENGYRILKVKGGMGMSTDLGRIERVREQTGSTVAIRVDPNQSWSRQEALAALPRLRDQGVAILEQPLHKGDLEGHALLRDQGQVPIMLDESVSGPADAQRAAEAGAADLLNIKLQKCGGHHRGLRIAQIAEAAGLECMVGCSVESRVGITQAAHLALAHPAIQHVDLDGALFLGSDPVEGGARYVRGALHVPGGPGTAIDAVRNLVPLV